MTNTNENEAYIKQLSESLVDEVVGAIGLSKNRFNHWLVYKLINPVTDRFAHGAEFRATDKGERVPRGE